LIAAGLSRGADGRLRCSWADASAEYQRYHDVEWGREVRGDVALFERLSLEAFQSGLSWITVLRKRESFRSAFAGFDPVQVASFGDAKVQQLMADASIIRNARKIEATISNARALAALWDHQGDQALTKLIWSHAREDLGRPRIRGDVPAHTPESTALSTSLKANGFRFVGPTTMYAAMQACGVVNDHLVDCYVDATGSRGGGG
jgi:DNA-3-methyladenine glycosylase I